MCRARLTFSSGAARDDRDSCDCGLAISSSPSVSGALARLGHFVWFMQIRHEVAVGKKVLEASMTYALRLFIALAVGAVPSGAMADSSSIGVSFTSDREEQNLGEPQSTKFEISASHIFDTGIALGTSAEYSDKAFSKSATLNLEATLGYRFHFNDALSMIGSIGIGERLQVSGQGDDIPYYVLRTGADLKLTKIVTWRLSIPRRVRFQRRLPDAAACHRLQLQGG
jgi:hypothetical protein